MQPRQHEVTRDAHRHMEQSLVTLRRMLTMRNHKRSHDDEIALIMGDLEFLEHVLQFSATWNGVPTTQFLPGAHDSEPLMKYLTENGMTRLGGFFARQFVDVAKELRALGFAYPSILRKLYESYYVVSIPKSRSVKVDVEI